jgi:hypothetical protein
MAENYGESGRESRSVNIELAVLAHEVRILVEVVLMGIQSLMDTPRAEPVREELAVLAKLAGQGAEALIALDAALEAPAWLRARENGGGHRFCDKDRAQAKDTAPV